MLNFGFYSQECCCTSRETCEEFHRGHLKFSPPVLKSDLKHFSTSDSILVSVREAILQSGCILYHMTQPPPHPSAGSTVPMPWYKKKLSQEESPEKSGNGKCSSPILQVISPISKEGDKRSDYI